MQPIRISEHWIATPRGRLFARSWNVANPATGPSIVLLHDSLGSVGLWRDFPDRLAAATGRSVVAYDRLGFGRSDPHPGRLAPDFVHSEARGDFAHVREAFGLARFVAIGHSVGGGMAAAVAAAYPDACTGLVTESAQAFVEDRTVDGILAAKRAFASRGQVERLAKYHGDKTRWVLDAWIDTWLAPEFADWNLDGELRRVRCPVLAIHGEGDEYGSMRHPERIASLAAGPASVAKLDCGHVPHREQAAEVIEAVRGWLDDSPPPALSTPSRASGSPASWSV